MGVRDQFRLEGEGGGGLRSLARILFYPVLARKSSGFARILRVFCPKMAILENSSSPPRTPIYTLKTPGSA